MGKPWKLMLREIMQVRQERVPGRRRWFESDSLDLVVWLDGNDRLQGFQICYELAHREFALTWRMGMGFRHDAVDMGEETPLKNLSPTLTADGKAPWAQILHLFDETSGSLEPELRLLIRNRLGEGSAAQTAQG